MSLDWCSACRHVGLCTFPRDRAVTECDEFEDMRCAPAFDWDLRELVRLVQQEKIDPDSQR